MSKDEVCAVDVVRSVFEDRRQFAPSDDSWAEVTSREMVLATLRQEIAPDVWAALTDVSLLAGEARCRNSYYMGSFDANFDNAMALLSRAKRQKGRKAMSPDDLTFLYFSIAQTIACHRVLARRAAEQPGGDLPSAEALAYVQNRILRFAETVVEDSKAAAARGRPFVTYDRPSTVEVDRQRKAVLDGVLGTKEITVLLPPFLDGIRRHYCRKQSADYYRGHFDAWVARLGSLTEVEIVVLGRNTPAPLTAFANVVVTGELLMPVFDALPKA